MRGFAAPPTREPVWGAGACQDSVTIPFQTGGTCSHPVLFRQFSCLFGGWANGRAHSSLSPREDKVALQLKPEARYLKAALAAFLGFEVWLAPGTRGSVSKGVVGFAPKFWKGFPGSWGRPDLKQAYYCLRRVPRHCSRVLKEDSLREFQGRSSPYRFGAFEGFFVGPHCRSFIYLLAPPSKVKRSILFLCSQAFAAHRPGEWGYRPHDFKSERCKGWGSEPHPLQRPVASVRPVAPPPDAFQGRRGQAVAPPDLAWSAPGGGATDLTGARGCCKGWGSEPHPLQHSLLKSLGL
jgi:hypothetical protein